MSMNWHNCYSPDRFGLEPETENPRSVYERDYDRIVFSSAFRRLQNKTQVFPLPEHVLVHNRLTHSLEVVSVGRSLGQMAGEALSALPEMASHPDSLDFYRHQLKNVISAACLAHDLGNPAFGHSGEEAISRFFVAGEAQLQERFTEAQWYDLTHFEGNANALRLLTHQFNGRLPGGYRLSFTSLAALLKYPCEGRAADKERGKHRSKYGFFQSERDSFLQIAEKLHLQKDSDAPLAYFRHPFVYLMEAADDICYSVIDYEDAHRLGILGFEETREDLLQLLESNPREDRLRLERHLDGLRDDANESIAYLRARVINYLVQACAEVFARQREAIWEGRFAGALLDHVTEAQPALRQIGVKSRERIYSHPSVVKIELAGYKIMTGLMEELAEAALTRPEQRRGHHKKLLDLLPVQYRFPESAGDYEKMMCLLDYVSGMTDNYALELYRNLRGISVPSI